MDIGPLYSPDHTDRPLPWGLRARTTGPTLHSFYLYLPVWSPLLGILCSPDLINRPTIEQIRRAKVEREARAPATIADLIRKYTRLTDLLRHSDVRVM